MNPNNFTENSMLALTDAQTLSQTYSQQSIKPEILALSLVAHKEGLITRILTKMNLDSLQLQYSLETLCNKLPKVTGTSSQIGIDSKTNEILNEAKILMESMGDSYISVEHIFLALLSKTSFLNNLGIDFNLFKKTVLEIRGNKKV
ncbi:MAG: Clp protease N-terminal domain-containing protein, partial [Cetobacterium sp.]